jgi:hypothetical protein
MNAYVKNMIIVLVALSISFSAIQSAFSARSSVQLGSTYFLTPDEVTTFSSLAATIANYSQIANLSTCNWYGDQTTSDNIFQAATGLGGPWSNCFYIDHGNYPEYVVGYGPWNPHTVIYNNSGARVFDFEIFPFSGQTCGPLNNLQCMSFAFLWACLQANQIAGYDAYGNPQGMPFAWLHNSSLSTNSWLNSDGGWLGFVGFKGYAPSFDSANSPYYKFLSRFYYYALCWGSHYSVNVALNMASKDVWGVQYFGQTDLYNGITYTWSGLDEFGHVKEYTGFGQLVCYGDTNIALSWGRALHGMKTNANGSFYVPNDRPYDGGWASHAIKLEMLFNDSHLVGDQSGNQTTPYPEIACYPDAIVDGSDMIVVARKFGKNESSPGWDYMADVYPDRVIDGLDILPIAQHFGYGPAPGNYTHDLNGVTITFDVGGTKSPDTDGFVIIPDGATTFSIARNSTPIGAMVIFWY